NKYLYQDDAPESPRQSALGQELLKELAFSAHLRPRLPTELIRLFEAKQQRTAPGYAPELGNELVDWVKERLLIPLKEWDTLLAAVERDHGSAAGEWQARLAGRIALFAVPGAEAPLIGAVEMLPEIASGLAREPEGIGVTPLHDDAESAQALRHSLQQLSHRRARRGHGSEGEGEDRGGGAASGGPGRLEAGESGEENPAPVKFLGSWL